MEQNNTFILDLSNKTVPVAKILHMKICLTEKLKLLLKTPSYNNALLSNPIIEYRKRLLKRSLSAIKTSRIRSEKKYDLKQRFSLSPAKFYLPEIRKQRNSKIKASTIPSNINSMEKKDAVTLLYNTKKYLRNIQVSPLHNDKPIKRFSCYNNMRTPRVSSKQKRIVIALPTPRYIH